MSGREKATHVKMFFREAIAKAVREEMAADPKVLVMGQDVGSFGGSYREFDGLFGEFGGDRVFDMPVSENATIGVGAGAAAAGYRPLVCITYMDFLMLGFDPLINYAAKLRYKTAGALTAPLVVKTTAGAQGQGVAHSQCLESWLMGVPGLKVVAPSNPGDAYGLMKSALRTDGPVVYIDHKRLFPAPGDVPIAETFTPFGEAVVRRSGRDVTIVPHGYMVLIAMEAARRMEEQSINCDVIDLRSLSPMDMGTIVTSVLQTGRIVTVEEGQLANGVGAEVTTRLFERIGPCPFARVGALQAPVSSNPIFERACVPDSALVCEAIRSVMLQ
jgi:acetoin:2,6-dichlorophenolindophenol oxidoreductase subunit beta